jgi:GTP-binding protein HflX
MLSEKALICGLFSPQQRESEIAACVAELRELCLTAGADVVAQTWQKRAVPDRKYLIGLGKAEEIKLQTAAAGANLVVFFNVLSSLQQRNLEDLLGIKVIDRSRLILDIFAAGGIGTAALPFTAPDRQRGGVIQAGRRHRHPRSR